LNDRRLSLSAISLIALLITTVAAPQAFAEERSGDIYDGSSSLTTQSDPGACGTLVGQSGQCEVFLDATNLPPPMSAVIQAQAGDILNPECVIIGISSGDVSDIGPTLSTNMLGDTCRDDAGNPETNPEGFNTNDCATIDVTPDQDSLIFFWTVEGDEFIGSAFVDWDRIQNGLAISVSLNDMVGHPTLVKDPSFNGGFSNTLLSSITEGTIAAGETVQLRIADSGDSILDSGKIVIPIVCLESPQSPLLCGNGQKDPGEACDDGNTEDGDGCSSLCLLENGTPPPPPPPTPQPPVGGEFIPLDSTALLIAGMSANLGLIVPIVAGIAGVGAYFIKTRMNKE